MSFTERAISMLTWLLWTVVVIMIYVLIARAAQGHDPEEPNVISYPFGFELKDQVAVPCDITPQQVDLYGTDTIGDVAQLHADCEGTPPTVADLVMLVYDADMGGEAMISVNGSTPMRAWESNSANDQKSVMVTVGIPGQWLQETDNIIEIEHAKTVGFRILSSQMMFNGHVNGSDMVVNIVDPDTGEVFCTTITDETGRGQCLVPWQGRHGVIQEVGRLCPK